MKEVKINDFDWDGFKRGEFRIVSASSQNLMLTLQALSEKGYVWGMTGSSLTEDEDMKNTLLRDVKREPIYICAGGVKKNGVVRDLLLSAICYSHDHWNACENPCDHMNMVEALNTVVIDFDERTDNDKIIITNDGKITTATLYSNGKKAGIGTAICHDSDKFDIYTGATLALLRLEKYKKKEEMTDWEKFVKGKVNMRVPKKHIQNFIYRTVKDGLTFKGKMPDWYLRWLTQDGDSILVAVIGKYAGSMFMSEVLRDDGGKTVDYIPGMK